MLMTLSQRLHGFTRRAESHTACFARYLLKRGGFLQQLVYALMNSSRLQGVASMVSVYPTCGLAIGIGGSGLRRALFGVLPGLLLHLNLGLLWENCLLLRPFRQNRSCPESAYAAAMQSFQESEHHFWQRSYADAVL